MEQVIELCRTTIRTHFKRSKTFDSDEKSNTVLQTPLVSDRQIAKYTGMPSCECAYDQFPSTLHVIMP